MVEVADIFRKYGETYRQRYKLPLRMHKVMSAIERCRTAELGGHVEKCNECGHIRISYNSCRNRHCPKCQGLAREKWLVERKKELLPVQYFHAVLTIPNTLNPLALRNQKEVYSILFKATSETLLELGRDPKYLGAEIGFISILHTWGQNLMDHPHIHCIIPGGGLSLDGKRWISSKNGFFIPVRVISRLFKGKFLAYLKNAYRAGKLQFEGTIQPQGQQARFQRLVDDLYGKEWVVYCKPSFNSPIDIMEYLGRYTHRVAISNDRILKIDDGMVTFKWQDYADGNKNKFLTVQAEEFIRRFLLHVLPDNFVKLRHYGILSNRNRKTALKKCQELLEFVLEWMDTSEYEESVIHVEFILQKCPCCETGRMLKKEILPPARYKPPASSAYAVNF
jgi:hypothetical protein